MQSIRLLNFSSDDCDADLTVDNNFNIANLNCNPTGSDVTFSVSDDCGNVSFCNAKIFVLDNSAPVITSCPGNRVVQCTDWPDDYNTIQAFEDAGGMAIDDCNYLRVASVDNPSRNDVAACLTGTIVVERTITVSDLCGQTAVCTQFISVQTTDPFSIDNIMWPEDIEVDACIDPPYPPTAGPVITGDACADVYVTYDDELSFVTKGCFKVLRRWKVIDWCQYDPTVDPTTGRWEDVQVIAIKNTMAPEFVNCTSPVEICVYDDSCTADVDVSINATDDCIDPSELEYVWHFDEFNDGMNISPLTGSGTGNQFIREDLEIGEHLLTWVVSDQCGNTNVCTQLLQVTDCKKPEVACIYGLAINLNQMPTLGIMASVWAKDFIASVGDNCTPMEELEFAFDEDFLEPSITFTCDILPMGADKVEVPVTIYVRDNAGQIGRCKTVLEVQDNFNLCDNTPITEEEEEEEFLARIAGTVATEDQRMIPAVDVMLRNNNMEAHAFTNDAGGYAFEDVEMYQNYSLSPSLYDDIRNGISTMDLILIQRHLLGLELLDSPYKIIAADVNNSETITAIDIIELRKVVLGTKEEFDDVDIWRFVEKSRTFNDPQNPFPVVFDSDVNNLDHDANNMDFIAIKSGDVDNSSIVNNFSTQNLNHRNDGTINLQLHKKERGLIQLTVNERTNLTGFQMILKSSQPVAVLHLESDFIDVGYSNYTVINNQIKISWSAAEALTLEGQEELFRIQLSNDVDLELIPEWNGFVSEAYSDQLEIFNLELNAASDESGWRVFNNTPNPFSETTQIPFIAPSSSNLTLTVLDVTGMVLYTRSKKVEKGFQFWTLDSTDFGNVHGVLYYRLESGTFSSTQPFIKLK